MITVTDAPAAAAAPLVANRNGVTLTGEAAAGPHPDNRNRETMRDQGEPLRCEVCKAEIGPDERVWRIGVMYKTKRARRLPSWGQRMENRCDDCREDPGNGVRIPHHVPTPPEEMGYEPGDLGWREMGEPCEACGRPVVALHPALHQSPPSYTNQSPPAIVCDDRCRRRAARKRRRERKARERRTDCQTCGEKFQPSRSDAKYCSNACRQKAYRQRQKTEKSPDGGTCSSCGAPAPDGARWCSISCAQKTDSDHGEE